MRLNLILMALVITGCQTVMVWDKGFPDKGDDPALFELESIDAKQVVAHGVRYTRESFTPIFLHATPEIAGALAEADARNADLQLASTGAVTIITYAIPPDWPNYVSRIRDVVTIGAYGAMFYFARVTKDAYQVAVDTYNTELRRHLRGKK